MEILPRFFQPSKQSFFLFGPRGTGKSTWLTQYFKDAVFLDLLSPEVYRTYSARPERLIELVEAHKPGTVFVIDEVQKIPELLDVVHQLLERHSGWRFVITGSSSRKLKRTGIDLLAGRAVLKTMQPFMASELKGDFSVKKALTLGMLPLVLYAPDPSETLAGYVSLYIREEVQIEGMTRNIGAFIRFLEAASFSHAAVLNIAAVARECQVERKTVAGYISILEDLLLSFRIPVFAKRAKRKLATHPKFYLFDAGVFRSLRPKGLLDAPQEIEGTALEGLIAQHLRAWIAYSTKQANLYFWRTKSGNEVDFVLYGEDVFCAIEVKNSTKIHPKMLNGLMAFRQDYPEAETYLLYRGKERLKKGPVLCIPCGEFLERLRPDQNISID